MYDAMNTIDPSSLTDGQLSTYYKAAPLDPAPGTVVKTENPKPGVTIKRDKYGVPYVYGTTDDDTAYGAGYAGTEDRMFVMDALRYAGSGRYSELLGASKDNIAQDAALLRQADYTPAEANAQLDALAKASPQGKELVGRLDAFVAGVNAARKAMCPIVTAPSCPTPYRLLKLTPTPYTRADVVYAGALIGGIYGKGGGQEAQNALFLRQLQNKLGADLGRKVLADLQDPLDPSAVVTDPGQQPEGQPGPIDPAAVALPDLPGGNVKIAAGTGGIPTSATPPSGAGAGGGSTLLDSLQMPAHMSNAMLVAGSHTTTGHPIAVMGPQTGYQAPNFWDEIALHGPHYDARGVAFANLQFAVLIGHGKSYAWSATSSSGDVVDTVLDKLCNTDGSKATINSTAYLNGSTCEPMTGTPHQIHDSTGKVVATLPDMRTRHGIVQYRTTADGTPVAVVSERSTYNHEVDSVHRLRADERSQRHSQRQGLRRRLQQGELHVQLVLHRHPRHRDVLLRGVADPRQGRRPGPPALGRREMGLDRLPADRPASAGDRSAVGLHRQLEQQALGRHLLRRRRVGLGSGATGAGATRPDPGVHQRRKAEPGHARGRHDRRGDGGHPRCLHPQGHAGDGR